MRRTAKKPKNVGTSADLGIRIANDVPADFQQNLQDGAISPASVAIINRCRPGLKPNAIYDCIICGTHVEKYVSPSAVQSGRDKLLFCNRTCAGIWRRGENHHQWKGGRILEADGYVMIHRPDHPHANNKGYVFEHRLVMESHIGRILDPVEVVHHKNDCRSDNRLENLHLYPSNAEHKRDDIVFRTRDKEGKLMPIEPAAGGVSPRAQLFNEDCITGLERRVSSNSVHLTITSIPFEEL